MPYRPPLYGIFSGHIFANMGGGGGQNYFHRPFNPRTVDHYGPTGLISGLWPIAVSTASVFIFCSGSDICTGST